MSRRQHINHRHERLIDRIITDNRLALLIDNASEDEIIVHAFNNHFFVESVLVAEEHLRPPVNQEDLLGWRPTPARDTRAGYTFGEDGDVKIAQHGPVFDCAALRDARALVFRRTFGIMRDDDRVDFEILQEYAHVTDIHLQDERHAYCRLDPNRDVEDVMSFTSDFPNMELVSFKRDPLDEYLAASGSLLVRLFEVPAPHADFPLDSDGVYAIDAADPDFFHRPSVGPTLAVRRGCQIIRPRKPKQHIFSTIRQREDLPDRVEGFVTAVDDRVRVEHFRFACFEPEVLNRYSSDIDKYTVQDGTISCRHMWSLHYDVNDSGQIHVYLKDLRLLPCEELKYWRTYNVGCETGLSEVTFARDIQGDWDRREPNEEVVDILRRWHASRVRWWRVAEPGLLEQVKTPLADNRTEWAGAFVTLSRLIIEGLQVKAIRKRLADMEIPYNDPQTSLNMIDTLLIGADTTTARAKIIGLRTVQRIRSKYSHAGGTDALELAKRALREHGTYASHFKHTCSIVSGELQLIERAMTIRSGEPARTNASDPGPRR